MLCGHVAVRSHRWVQHRLLDALQIHFLCGQLALVEHTGSNAMALQQWCACCLAAGFQCASYCDQAGYQYQPPDDEL
jgi:hypothetical protein